jgi:4-oxalocrotonate tautomerase
MPFVNISIYEGHGKERKDELARRITETVSEVCKVPAHAVWVTFSEIPPPDWYVAGKPGEPMKA